MKRLLFGILCVVMIAALWGCEKTTEKKEPTDSVKETAESTEAQSVPETTTPELPKEDPYAPIIEALLKGNDEMEGIVGFPMMSYMYIRYDVPEICYALEDLDGDGQAELLLSSKDAPFVFDGFTVKDGMLLHLFTSGERHSYQVCADGYLKLTWSGNAAQSGTDYFQLKNEEMVFLERITYDAQYAEKIGLIDDLSKADSVNSYFISTSEEEKDYQSVSAEEAVQKMQEFNDLHPELKIQYVSITQYVGIQ